MNELTGNKMIASEAKLQDPSRAGENKHRPTLLFIGKESGAVSQVAEILHADLVRRESTYSAVSYLVSGGRPDLIFFRSPGDDEEGIEFHQYLRKQPEFNRTAFILVSGKFRDEIFKKASLSGIDDYYVVPLPDPSALASRARFLMGYRSRKPAGNDIPEPGERIRIPVSKRVFDLVFASTALVLLSPLLVLVMVAIRIESRGKVYYTSRRIGQKPFNFYKFRSMRTGADAELGRLAKERNKYGAAATREIDFNSPCPRCSALGEGTSCSPMLHVGPHHICEYWYQYQKAEIERSRAAFIKIKDDPRITRVGKIIRDLSIDELPQLINVIKGDMSLVGNRPLPVYEAEKLTNDEAAQRFLSPAGLTGLWQVELRGRAGNMSEEERKRLDNKYAAMFLRKKYSFWYDLKLILRTIPAIFQKETV